MGRLIGECRERIVVQQAVAPLLALTSLVQAGGTAAATYPAPHGYQSGDVVAIAGAAPAGYNGNARVTVTGDTTLTFAVASGLSSPATGAITSQYLSDGKGGRAVKWQTVDTLPAELQPLRAYERLEADAFHAVTLMRFRVRAQPWLMAGLRVLWTPRTPEGAPVQTLQITGVTPNEEDRLWMILDVGAAK